MLKALPQRTISNKPYRVITARPMKRLVVNNINKIEVIVKSALTFTLIYSALNYIYYKRLTDKKKK
jgi:hypothetical protein